MRKLGWLLTSIAVVSWPAVPRAHAEAMDEGFLFMEMPSVVTASKREESMISAPGTVYVITDKDIKRYGWRNMQEALASIPNLDYKYDYNWLAGGQRGFSVNSSGTLLLLNGREIQNNIAGEAFQTSGVSLSRVKRIEVLPGPNSTLYGANAMEGIINIITKTGDGQPDNNEVDVIEGDHGLRQYSAEVRKDNPGDLSFGFDVASVEADRDWKELASFWNNQRLYSRGTNDPLRLYDESRFYNGEKDLTYDLHARYKDVYAGANYWSVQSGEGLEGVRYDTRSNLASRGYAMSYAGMDHKFGDAVKAMVEARRFLNDESWTAADPTSASVATAASYADLAFQESVDRAVNERRQLVGQLDWNVSERNSLTTGADFRFFHDRADRVVNNAIQAFEGPDEDLSDPANAYIESHGRPIERSYFVQDAWSLVPDKLKFTGGLMYHNRTFSKDAWLPRGSLVFQPRPTSAIKLTYGQGFRALTPYEISSILDNLPAGQPIPNFNPIKMDMWEFNYSQSAQAGPVSLTNINAWYLMRESNVVVTGATLQANDSMSSNFTVRGVEDQLKAQIGRFQGFADFRLAVPDKVSTEAGPSIHQNIPLTKEKLGLSYDVTKRMLASFFIDHWASVKKETFGWDPVANQAEAAHIIYTIPAWTAVNMNLSLHDFDLGGAKADLSFYVENLFNTAYFQANQRDITPFQYLQPPRNYRLALTIKV